jgi:hypothetical protein
MVHEKPMEGQPNEVTRPQTTTVTTEPWDPLALKSHKIKKRRTQSRNT